ncbi:MAG: MerR family transcriptional regulator [Oscillospiraceae bacterium]|nr:MerR family transcriptional regulator [Oscillospiraceae bacterium]
MLNGLCITDAVKQFGVTSKTLRYYEHVGLLEAKRADNNNYRYYNESEVERIKQIMVLRKMQISIKDIIRIYENEDMSTVVEVFVNRIHAIDDEIGALAELKRIVGEFLQTMLDNGITKISAIPLLYEEMDKQLELMEKQKPITYGDLSAVSEKLARPISFSIVDLPPCRVLTSFLKPDMNESDYTGFSRYMQINGLSQATSGNHQQFEYQTEKCDVLMVQVPEDFVNDSKYLDYHFLGGLFAVVNLYLDEDLRQCFRALVWELDTNPYWQFAYCDSSDGSTRHPTLIENLISPDDKRELVSMFVPIKKRMPDVSLFDPPQEVTNISFEEIEAANPVLWEIDVPIDKLTPINNPHYKVLENGEAEYTGWISTRVLSTNVEVKLPFRVDVEFRCVSTGERFSYGDSEGSIICITAMN